MFFILEVIGVSILVSIFATWVKLIPRYPKKRYNLIQQLLNTGLMTCYLTLVAAFGFYTSWTILFVIIFLILWLSARLTNNMVRKDGESMVNASSVGTNKQEPQSH